MRTLKLIFGVLALVMVGLIIWIDVTTDMWQKYVVISGLAGGLVTFVFTALIVDKVVARSAHERWEPVTRIALGDLRRQLVDADREPRLLPAAVDSPEAIAALIAAADDERDRVSEALARWASFLASSADVDDILDAAADLALSLDRIDADARAMIGVDGTPSAQAVERLRQTRDAHAAAAAHLVARVDEVLRGHARWELARGHRTV